MKYLELLRLDIVHSYYADSRCPDFQIEPIPETQKLLRNFRCVLKTVPGGIRILVPVSDANSPFIPLPPTSVFGFQLHLLNPAFPLFTDMSNIESMPAPLYTNAGGVKNGILNLVTRTVSSTEKFIAQTPAKTEQFVLGGHPLAGLKAKDFIVTGLRPKSGIKVYTEAIRTVGVDSSSVSQGTPFTITYPIIPQLGRGVFAKVEIQVDDAITKFTGITSQYQIVFVARRAKWKYYLVSDKLDGQSVTVALQDRDKVVIFDAQGQTDLTQSPDPSDSIGGAFAKVYPDKQLTRFVSNAVIPCQQTTRSGIQLQMNGDTVMDTLPNPPLQNYCIDVRKATQEYTLYQNILYFTR